MVISGVVSAQGATNDPTTIEVIEQVGSTVESTASQAIEGVGATLASTSQGTIERVGDEIVSLSSSLYDGAKSAISDLAKALEVPATHVYEILVRQQVVHSVSLLCLLIFSLIMCVFSTILGLKKYTDWLFFENRDISPYILIPIIFGLIFGVILFFGTEEIVAGLINPEYGAMKEVVGWIK